MGSLAYMTLKVLYTLDDGRNNNYLARSSRPVQVQVATIPMPCISHSNNNTNNSVNHSYNYNYNYNNGYNNQSNNDNNLNLNSNSSFSGNFMKIGAVRLSHVLREIRSSSPELLLLLLSSSQNTKGTNDQNVVHSSTDRDHDDADHGRSTSMYYDYNVYYRDVCEEDEPLVSLGLLSKIRTNEEKEKGKGEEEEEDEVSDNDNDDQPLVVGRVCTNFAALVTRPNRKTQDFSGMNLPAETLEVKIRFSKVPVVSTDNVSSSKPPTYSNKRKTNGNPAPRAERTLSLPVWNANVKSNPTNQELFTTSIAHKIYLADRQYDMISQDSKLHDLAANINSGGSPSTSTQFHYQPHQVTGSLQDYTTTTTTTGTLMPYREGNQLARHKLRTDQDDVSKRFEFMLNKKRPTTAAGTKTKSDGIKKPKKKIVKPSRSKNKDINKNKSKNKDKNKPPLPLPMNTTDKLKSPRGTNNTQSPSQIPNPQDPTLKTTDNSSTTVVTPMWFHNSATVTNIDISSGTTPNDIPTIGDPDRTSPIDTLSMPLMEFAQQQQQERTPNVRTNLTAQLNLPDTKRNNSLIPQEQNSKDGSQGKRKKMVSCQEQLRRIPLLSQRKQSSVLPINPSSVQCSSTVTNLGTTCTTRGPSPSDYVGVDIDAEAFDLKLDDIDEIPSIFDIGTFPVDFSLDDGDGDCKDGENGNTIPQSTCISEFDAPDTVPSTNDALVITGLGMGKVEGSTLEGKVGEELELDLELELEEEEAERQKRRAMPSSPSMMHTYSTLHENANMEVGENGTVAPQAPAADVVSIDINNEDDDENDGPIGDCSEASATATANADANDLFAFTPVSKHSGAISSSDIMDSDLQGQETPATTVRYSSSDSLGDKK